MSTALPTGTINFMRIAARSAVKSHRPTCAMNYALPVVWKETEQPQVVSVLVRQSPGALSKTTTPTADHASRITGLCELVF